jgi:hypothetical protein
LSKPNYIIKCLTLCFLALLSSNSNLSLSQSGAVNNNELLRQRAKATLHQLPKAIKDLDEPAIRVYLRYKVASYLWAKGFKEEFTFAETLVADALEDLYLHKDDMKDSDLSYYQSELLALLRTYSPALSTKLTEKYEINKDGRDDFRIAYSMLDNKDGIAQAVGMASRSLKNGQDGGLALLIFMTDLERERPQQYLGLLREILAAEDLKPGTFSITSLYMLKSLYLKSETPVDLKLRFLAVIVSATEWISSGANSGDLVNAYQLLNAIYSEIERLAPSLYTRARAAMSALNARVPGKVIEQIAVQARVERSNDPLKQLIIEIDANTNESDKDDLRTQAATIALEKGELELATELAAKTSAEGQHGLWRDQFLEEIVDAAIKKKDETAAQYALSKMKSYLNRASVTQKLALFFFESRDKTRAVEWMNAAVKLVESSDNNPEKARKFLEMAANYKKIDSTRVPDIIQSAIKSINRISKPGLEEKEGSLARRAYADALTSIAWYTIPAFRILSQQDEIGASLIAKSIQVPEIRTAAIWGTTCGLFEAIKPANVVTK